MQDFNMYQPTKVEEVLNLMKEKDDYQLLAGGTDLMVRWKRGDITSKNVINLKKIEALYFIDSNEEEMEIGALIKVSELIENNFIEEYYPALHKSAKEHSSPMIRNLATMIGNICNASPAADLIPTLLVYNAKVKVVNEDEELLIDLKDFFMGPGKTTLAENELVVSIILPIPEEDRKSYFMKDGKRKAHEIAVVNCAVSYLANGDQIADMKVALGAVGPTPVFLELDWFDSIDETNLNRLQRTINEEISPISDQRSTGWYRRDIIQTLTRRAIIKANSTEGGEE